MPSASTLCVPNGTHQFINDFASTKIKKQKKKHRVQNHLPHGGGVIYFFHYILCAVWSGTQRTNITTDVLGRVNTPSQAVAVSGE
jgi:hypothetical protein